MPPLIGKYCGDQQPHRRHKSRIDPFGGTLDVYETCHHSPAVTSAAVGEYRRHITHGIPLSLLRTSNSPRPKSAPQ
jgi:hypothetical protein